MKSVLWTAASIVALGLRTIAMPVCVPCANRMCDERWAPGMVCLLGGKKALIVGGYSYAYTGCTGTADLFDEATRKFSTTKGRLTYPRDFPGTALLPNGLVLVTGGYNPILGTLKTAEVFDPSTGTFRLLTHQMRDARELFSTTVLKDGRVLIAGGFSIPKRTTVSSAEIFNPDSELFAAVPGGMSQDRFGQSAVLLIDGRVLIVGGKHWSVGSPDHVLNSAEIYDPVTGRFHATLGVMNFPRDRPTTSLLADGTVLIAGGQDGTAGPLALEKFDPKTEQFSELPESLQISRMAHSAAHLPDGDLLVAGGWSPALGRTTETTEIVSPDSSRCDFGPSLPIAAHDMGTTEFSDGQVIFAGGKTVESGRENSSNQGMMILVRGNSK